MDLIVDKIMGSRAQPAAALRRSPFLRVANRTFQLPRLYRTHPRRGARVSRRIASSGCVIRQGAHAQVDMRCFELVAHIALLRILPFCFVAFLCFLYSVRFELIKLTEMRYVWRVGRD